MDKKVILKSRSVGATTMNTSVDTFFEDQINSIEEVLDNKNIDVSAMPLQINTDKSITRVEMFSLNRYLVKKSKTRLTKATVRQARRDAKVAKK